MYVCVAFTDITSSKPRHSPLCMDLTCSPFTDAERKKEQTAPGSLTSCPTLKENTTDFLAFACYFHTTCNFQLPLREAPNLQKNAKLQ